MKTNPSRSTAVVLLLILSALLVVGNAVKPTSSHDSHSTSSSERVGEHLMANSTSRDHVLRGTKNSSSDSSTMKASSTTVAPINTTSAPASKEALSSTTLAPVNTTSAPASRDSSSSSASTSRRKSTTTKPPHNTTSAPTDSSDPALATNSTTVAPVNTTSAPAKPDDSSSSSKNHTTTTTTTTSTPTTNTTVSPKDGSGSSSNSTHPTTTTTSTSTGAPTTSTTTATTTTTTSTTTTTTTRRPTSPPTQTTRTPTTADPRWGSKDQDFSMLAVVGVLLFMFVVVGARCFMTRWRSSGLSRRGGGARYQHVATTGPETTMGYGTEELSKEHPHSSNESEAVEVFVGGDGDQRPQKRRSMLTLRKRQEAAQHAPATTEVALAPARSSWDDLDEEW